MLSVLALTAPIYLLIGAGYAATRCGLFERADMRVLGKYVIYLALPALLFNALSQRPLGEIINPVFLAAYAGGSLVAMGAGLWWSRRLQGMGPSASAIVGLGMCSSNSGFIGFPLAAQVVGPSTAAIGLALAMLVENLLVIPLGLALADGQADQAGQGGASRGQRLRAAFMQSLCTLARNPIIHGLVLGLLFSVSGLRLPEPFARAVSLLAVSCTALSLFVIGGSLVGISIGSLWKPVSMVAAGKLLLHPLAVLFLVMVMPPIARDLQIAAVLFAAVPIMGIYAILAQRHGHEGLAAASQMVATLASFVTLTIVLWALGSGH